MSFKTSLTKKERKRKKEREDIVMELPSFINKIMLLMNTGMTVNDAFGRVASQCRELPETERNSFTEKVSEIQKNSERNGENVIDLFYSYARMTSVKELTKAAGFLYENQDKGTDIYERLADLSEGLWEERKRLCMERIRTAGVKMSFPLGVMLISLIIMTAAPALLQM